MIGCGQIKPHRDGSYELASIAVHPEFREQGVARSIIAHLLESHRDIIYLTCRVELGVFYQKFGFRVASKWDLPNYFLWVRRLFRMLKTFKLVGEELLVMVRDPLTNQQAYVDDNNIN